MKLFFMGMFIGIGKILPGISGSILAIRLGVYEKVISCLSHFREHWKENLSYLGILGSGFVASIILGSKLLLHVFLHYELFLKIFFLLFLLTGIPELVKKSNGYKISIVTFCLGSLFFFLPLGKTTHFSFLTYGCMGIIEAISTIIPGLSGTAIYLSLGWYEELLFFFSYFYYFSLLEIISFVMGLVFSSYFLIKLLQYLFDRYSGETYSGILGFFLSSIFFLF